MTARLETLPADARYWVVTIENLDRALEWCEDRLLLKLTERRGSERELPLGDHEM